MLRLVLALFTLNLLPMADAYAQTVISEQDAIKSIEAIGRHSCALIPVGTHKTLPLPILEGMVGDPQHNLVKRVVAFEKAGVVAFSSVGNLMENTLTVQLKPGFDKKNLVGDSCLLSASEYNISKVIKIDSAQGGSSIKWNASLVYVLFNYKSNPFYGRYLKAIAPDRYTEDGERKGVFLFRQDVFSGRWTQKTADTAYIAAPP